jgi:hypothetical protein
MPGSSKKKKIFLSFTNEELQREAEKDKIDKQD